MSDPSRSSPDPTWVYVSAAAFVAALLVAGLLIAFADRLTFVGIAAHYVLLTPLALAAVALLLGAMRSHPLNGGAVSRGPLQLELSAVTLFAGVAGLILLTAAPLAAQETVTFQARLVHVDGLSTGNLEIELGTFGSAVTRRNGFFRASIPAGVAEVPIGLRNSNWVVLYPRDGRVSVPRDANAVPQIVIGESVEAAALRTFAERHQKLARELAEAGAEPQEIRVILQGFVDEVATLLAIPAADVDRQIELQRQRAEHFPALAATITAYLVAAEDLTNFVKLYGRQAFTDSATYQRLADEAERYSAAFQRLNSERPGVEYQVATYWESGVLRADLESVYDFALGEIHNVRMLQLYEAFMAMRESVWGGFRDRRRVQDAQQAFETTVRELDMRIPELRRRTERLLTALQSR